MNLDDNASLSDGAGKLVGEIVKDLQAIVRDEAELVASEFTVKARTMAAEAVAILVAALVALVGLGMLCVVVVAALAPVIPQLWLRLLIMAAVYLVIGGGVSVALGKRLTADMKPDLAVPKHEAKRTIAGIKAAITQT
ncbi:MAG TPA: phage holin family protein [Kofleriaceae bacterium]|jgi:hypothetical protein